MSARYDPARRRGGPHVTSRLAALASRPRRLRTSSPPTSISTTLGRSDFPHARIVAQRAAVEAARRQPTRADLRQHAEPQLATGGRRHRPHPRASTPAPPTDTPSAAMNCAGDAAGRCALPAGDRRHLQPRRMQLAADDWGPTWMPTPPAPAPTASRTSPPPSGQRSSSATTPNGGSNCATRQSGGIA